MNQTDKLVVHKLKKIAIISLIFMSIQILGGALAHSIAIMADAFHLLSDVIAYVISLYAVLLSTKQTPKYLSFGYQKAQPLGALINVAIIWCVTVELFIQATHRIISQEVVQQPLFMLVTSVFGLGCNLFIMKTLHSGDGHGCGHDHGHSHGHKHQHHQHQHHQHQHQLDSHSHEDQLNNKSLLNGYVQAVCSCNSQGEKIKNKQLNNDSPLQLNLQVNNVNKSKHKGYCALHTGQNYNKRNTHNRKHNHNHGEDHQHDDHSHQQHQQHSYPHQKKQKKQFQNINMQAAYIHILSDIILSIGVIVSASIIYFVCGQDKQWSYWQLADPFCTYLFSVVALYSTISIMKQSIVLLLDGCDDKEMTKRLEYMVKILEDKNKGVKIGEFKLWSSNRGKHYMAVKISNKCKHNHDGQHKHDHSQHQHDHPHKLNYSKSNQLSIDRQTRHSQQQHKQIDHVYEALKKFCEKQKITSFIETQQNHHHH